QKTNRLAEGAEQAAHLAFPRTRQYQQLAWSLPSTQRLRLLRFRRRKEARIGGQAVADECSRRPAQPLQFARFKWQQAKNIVDIRPHGRRPARPPGPYTRTDIMHYRYRWVSRPHLFRHTQAEIRTVDGDEAIRPGCNNASRRLADAQDQSRQIAYHRAYSHK